MFTILTSTRFNSFKLNLAHCTVLCTHHHGHAAMRRVGKLCPGEINETVLRLHGGQSSSQRLRGARAQYVPTTQRVWLAAGAFRACDSFAIFFVCSQVCPLAACDGGWEGPCATAPCDALGLPLDLGGHRRHGWDLVPRYTARQEQRSAYNAAVMRSLVSL